MWRLRSSVRSGHARLCACVFLALFILFSASRAVSGDQAPRPLSFGITAVFLVDQENFLSNWKRYLETRLGRPVQFVRRKSYAEITDMLLNGQLDAAWICSFPYVLNRQQFRLLATPVFHGEPYYRSYLIVSADDHRTRGYRDLKGKVFAYVEPRSNTGYLYPRYRLHQLGLDDRQFFRDTVFTWTHANVIRAVAEKMADAGALDGYIWEVIRHRQPALAIRTRVVARSDKFGFPPIVASASTSEETTGKLQEILLEMHLDPEGKRLLDKLELDRMILANPSIYDSVEAMIGTLAGELALRP